MLITDKSRPMNTFNEIRTLKMQKLRTVDFLRKSSKELYAKGCCYSVTVGTQQSGNVRGHPRLEDDLRIRLARSVRRVQHPRIF